ncbi:hypothetical protein E3J79_01125 [Candidatus Dependentiae bacterium]|nr:MAG: hypothetical protein E3J79_01125 [Candidatus Dependentiae bacterium]
MKKWFVFHVLLCIAGISQAMDKSNEQLLVELPRAQVLRKRLEGAGFDHFLEITKLDEELGSKRQTPDIVALNVERALCYYIKSFGVSEIQAGILESIMKGRKGKIIDLIFQKNRRVTL